MFKRSQKNPILSPSIEIPWSSYASFNPCVVKTNSTYHLLYRAESLQANGVPISSIGCASSKNGIDFTNHTCLIDPRYSWEQFGCEDPRVTYFEGKYYIFYTALSSYPFHSLNIKVGLAITKDLKKIDSKHLVTTFNSKAMALFPERIQGKIAAILTTHTDLPPAKIALAFFDTEAEIWSEQYWNLWYYDLDRHVIPLLRKSADHLEVGAPPIKTPEGWLVIYSYIENYSSSARTFGIEALLLDLNDPTKVIGKTSAPLMMPETQYELHGRVPNVIFPSGALLKENKLMLYYGAADTSCCLATANMENLLKTVSSPKQNRFLKSKKLESGFKRSSLNPILSPRPEFEWEAKSVFNPAAFLAEDKIHIVYRAMSNDGTSTLGYASTSDGTHITQRLISPIYKPRASFEQKLVTGYSGCEDPRLTCIENKIYMFYTAFDGLIARVAFTSIEYEDFSNKNWDWSYPRAITPPNVFDKDACLFPTKINNQFVLLHRIDNKIQINFLDDLIFKENQWISYGQDLIWPTEKNILKVGASAPPLQTHEGWLLFYHYLDLSGCYHVAAVLLDLKNPTKVISQSVHLLEPEEKYEMEGMVPTVVFPCGAVLLNKDIFLYYGAADSTIGVAKIALSELLNRF